MVLVMKTKTPTAIQDERRAAAHLNIAETVLSAYERDCRPTNGIAITVSSLFATAPTGGGCGGGHEEEASLSSSLPIVCDRRGDIGADHMSSVASLLNLMTTKVAAAATMPLADGCGYISLDGEGRAEHVYKVCVDAFPLHGSYAGEQEGEGREVVVRYPSIAQTTAARYMNLCTANEEDLLDHVSKFMLMSIEGCTPDTKFVVVPFQRVPSIMMCDWRNADMMPALSAAFAVNTRIIIRPRIVPAAIFEDHRFNGIVTGHTRPINYKCINPISFTVADGGDDDDDGNGGGYAELRLNDIADLRMMSCSLEKLVAVFSPDDILFACGERLTITVVSDILTRVVSAPAAEK
jgi:hypothetical protein